jgi:hypothetical protein
MELESLGRLTLRLAPPIDAGKTAGRTAQVLPIDSGSWEGSELAGEVVGPSADWFSLLADRTGLIDGRLCLATSEGIVLVSYVGRADYSAGWDAPAHVALTFETAIESKRWLTRRLAVGRGVLRERVLSYEVALLT